MAAVNVSHPADMKRPRFSRQVQFWFYRNLPVKFWKLDYLPKMEIILARLLLRLCGRKHGSLLYAQLLRHARPRLFPD